MNSCLSFSSAVGHMSSGFALRTYPTQHIKQETTYLIGRKMHFNNKKYLIAISRDTHDNRIMYN